MCNILVAAGIKGILNFAPVILKVPEEIVIDNINLSNKLEGILYNIGMQGEELTRLKPPGRKIKKED